MMKILVLCDDIWHPAEVIERGMACLKKTEYGKEYEFDYVMDARDILTPELLREYPVVVNAKGNNLTSGNDALWMGDGISEVGPEELRAYVEAGGGLLSLHSGNSFRAATCPGYTQLVGNSFVKHPARCEVRLLITQRNPITEGVEDFSVRDEHYELDHLTDDRDEFMISESDAGGRQTAGYTRQIGQGRICVLTPGHILSVFENPQYQRLICNAVEWCAGRR